MASTVGRNRSRCHVTECRAKIKRDKTPSRQSSTPEGEDSGVQLDEVPAFSCGFYRPEAEIILLPHLEAKQLVLPEVISERDDDAMTVQASDICCRAARISSTSTAKNCPAAETNRKSRDTNGSRVRKSFDSDQERHNSDADRKSLSPDLNRKSNGADVGRDLNADRSCRSFDEQLTSEAAHAHLTVPGNPRRVRGSTGGVEFLTGSDPETDGESEGISFLSAPETMPPKKPCRDTRNKMRFKKFFRPLPRSKSSGSTSKGSSAFSFFHKQETDSDDRQSVDTGRGSMEPVSDREMEEEKDKDTSSKEKKKKSITTEVREKLNGLRRRYTDLTMTPKDGKSDKAPTPEVIKNWSKNIEFLLADKFGLQCFHAFLKSEFSEENIDFWKACESYKTLKPSKQPMQAQKIFSEYITHQAPREINIDSVTREETCARMVHPDSKTFDAAQKRIQALMDKDSYPRFIESTLYQELVTGQSPLLS